MTSFTFSDKITDNYVVIKMDRNICWMDKYYVDSDNGKLFIVILKEAFDKMKKQKCDTFIQHVDENDWDCFLKSDNRWKVLNNENGIVHISCNINDALECIISGFGIINS
jgi:hypothetical protein